jgi:uncharacterized protein YndB with AHSA1/START domain
VVIGPPLRAAPRLYLVNVTGARFTRSSFREVVPVHRLACSFGRGCGEEASPGLSRVEIELIERPDGRCCV